MSEIILIDTSIYMNILDVPGYNQRRLGVLAEFESRIGRDDRFLLPMATVWESGNHIARLGDGGQRRRFARKLVEQVVKAADGEAPYRPIHFPDRKEFIAWIKEFPDYAMRGKSVAKPGEGISLADLSIIKEWQRTKAMHGRRTVAIWSLDQDLSGYRHEPAVGRD